MFLAVAAMMHLLLLYPNRGSSDTMTDTSPVGRSGWWDSGAVELARLVTRLSKHFADSAQSPVDLSSDDMPSHGLLDDMSQFGLGFHFLLVESGARLPQVMEFISQRMELHVER